MSPPRLSWARVSRRGGGRPARGQAGGQQVVQRHGDDQAHDPRQVRPVHRAGRRAGPQAGRHEGDLDRDADEVGGDADPAKPPVLTAAGVEERLDVVLAVPDEVVVDQVDRGPRDEDVQQQQDEVGVVGEEVRLQADGQDQGQGDNGDREDGAGPGGGYPLAGEGLSRRDRAEHAAVQVDRVGVHDAQREDDHDQPADAAAEGVQLADLVGVAGGDAHHGAERHGQDAAQDGAPVRHPEGGAGLAAGRHVTGVVRDVGRVGDLPEHAERHGRQEAAAAEVAGGQEVGGQAVHPGDEDQAEDHHAAEQDDRPSVHGVDHVVAEDRDHQADDGADHDAGVDADAAGQRVDGLAAEDQVGGEEADVHHYGDQHDQQRAEVAELGPALDHLRHAEPRALSRVQRHEQRADDVAEHDRDQAPPEAQAVDG